MEVLTVAVALIADKGSMVAQSSLNDFFGLIGFGLERR